MDEPTANTQELRNEFQTKKKELSSLRSQLLDLSKNKELAFRELRSIHDKIKSRTTKIKQLKEERDSITKEVKQLKETRDKLNQVVHEKASVRKEIDEKKKNITEKSELKNPNFLKRQIEHLEHKRETEVMAFTKEQALTKEIKQLKAQLKEAEKLGDAWKEINTLSADFSETRREAQESHHKVQEKAQESQKRHETINSLYEEVKKFHEQEKPLSEKAMGLKIQFEQQVKVYDELQLRVTELAKLFQEEDQKSYKEKAREKTAEVQEKLRKGKKLSTEDILAFQATKE